MGLKDIITKLLGAEPTAETIATKIREAGDNRAKLLAEIEGLNRSRQDMIGDPKAKERARKRVTEARDEIEDIDAMIPSLQARYQESQAQEAIRSLARHRAALLATFESLHQAILAADVENRKSVSVWEAACADLGHEVVHLNFPVMYYGAPLNAETIAHWYREVSAALLPVKSTPAVAPALRSVAPVPRPAHSFQHRVRLDERPEQPATVKRAPIFETPGEGEVAMRVLRAGYESPSGKVCRYGDVVAVPTEIAAVAAKNSALDYYRGDAA